MTSEDLQSLLLALGYAIIPLLFIALCIVLVVVGENKVLTWVRKRFANKRFTRKRERPQSLFRPLADIPKILSRKEEEKQLEYFDTELSEEYLVEADAASIDPAPVEAVVRPARADLASYLLFGFSYACFAVIPFSAVYVGAKLNAGGLYFIALSMLLPAAMLVQSAIRSDSLAVMRSIHSITKMLAYQVPIAVAILSIVMLAGSMDLDVIVHLQSGGVQNWFLFGGPKTISGFGGANNLMLIPFLVIAFVSYILSSLAAIDRLQRDYPRPHMLDRSQQMEYSAIKLSMRYVAEYIYVFALGAMAVTLFLGGWQSPLGGTLLNDPWTDFLWFILKGVLYILLLIVARWLLARRKGSFPRMAWKVLIPCSLATLCVIAAVIISFQ